MMQGTRADASPPSSAALAEYLSAVRAIAQSASAEPSAIDPEAVARDAVQTMARITGLPACSIYLADFESRLARCVASIGWPTEFATHFTTIPLDSALLTARALHTGEPQYSGAAMPVAATQEALGLAGGNTFIIVPFHSGGRVIGTINCVGRRDAPPAPTEIALLQIVAEQIGHAVGATRLHHESAVAGARARFLADVSRAFNATLDLTEVLDDVARRATTVLGDWCVIYLRDEDQALMPMRAVHHRDPARVAIVRDVFASRPVRVGEGVAGTVVLTGEPRVFREFGEEQIRALAPRDDAAYLRELRQIRSWACLPLISRGHGVGALVIASSERPLDDADIEFAGAFAEIGAGAIENARLYQTERELRLYAEEAQAQLAAADRQKDEFLSVASHELRTPLTSAQGFAQVLLRRLRRQPDADPQQLEGLVIMEAQIRRIGGLLNELLDFTRIQTGVLPLRPAAMDLGGLALAVVERMRTAPGGDRITLEIPPLPLVGAWDRDRIEQVVVNLLENAVKYSPGGGPIDVAVSHTDGWASVRVRDHGIGVPASAMGQLFQRFYRIQDDDHRQINGIGVGLYICRDIAERHGGSVGVEQPDAGPGSVFVLRLPLEREAEPPARE